MSVAGVDSQVAMHALSGFRSRYMKPIKCRYSRAAVTSAA